MAFFTTHTATINLLFYFVLMKTLHKNFLFAILCATIIVILLSILPDSTYIIEYYDENMILQSETFTDLDAFNQRCDELDSTAIYITVI